MPPTVGQLPYRMRCDLQVTPVEWGGEVLYVVKDPVSLRYFHISASQFHALTCLDGRRGLRDWQRQYESTSRNTVHTLQLRNWLQEFLQWGLVQREKLIPGWTAPVPRGELWKKLGRQLRQPLYIQFPAMNPGFLLDGVERSLGWLAHPAMVVLTLLMAGVVWLQTLIHADEFLSRLPGWETWNQPATWVSLWLAVGVSKVIHELAHGLVARRVGAECSAMGFALVMFSPCLYCDVSDAWCLPHRRDRLAIALAGIWAETVLGALALAGWWMTSGGWFHDWCWHVTALTCLSTALVNLNPLVRYDGYFVLSDLMGVPNLRQQADREWDQCLKRLVQGSHIDQQAGTSARRFPFALPFYAWASGMYRLVTLGSITAGLYYLLQPWGLQNGAWLFAATAIGAIAINTGRRLVRVFGGGKGPRPWLVSGAGLLCCGCLAAAAGLYPLELCDRAPFVIEIGQPQSVYITTAGELISISVKPGEQVEAGQILAELRNTELEQKRLNLIIRCAHQQQEIELARLQNQTGSRAEAEAVLKTLEDELGDVQRRQQRLVLVAPCAGRVIFPDPVATEQNSFSNDRLSQWSGYPLAANQLGAWLETGTLALKIEPSATLRAVVQISQRQRSELSEGASLELRPDGCPWHVLPATVATIASRTTHEWPQELSHYPRPTREGGWSSTADPQTSGEIATLPLVAAVQSLPISLPLGSTGWARFPVRPRTGWEWAIDFVQVKWSVFW